MFFHSLKAGVSESNGEAEEHGYAVTDLCTTMDGSLVAVALQRQVSHFLLHGIIFPLRRLQCWSGLLTIPLFDSNVAFKE